MSYGIAAPDAQAMHNKDGKDGKGKASEPVAADALLAYQRVQERIERTFSDPRYEPPKLPAVALELLELARRPEVEIRDVVSLIEKDPILASQLLRHVRSPLYAGGSEIRSLQKALMHLGLAHIRDIALELTVGARVFRAEHYSEAMDRVSRHSRLTAYLTQVVCRHAHYDASLAFLCGLLHDVGLAAGLIALGDVPRSEDRPDIEVALPVLLGMHVELGGQVAQSWNLSPEVINVIRHHHELADADGQVQLLAAVVYLAESLADELGIGDASLARPELHQAPAPGGKPGAVPEQIRPQQLALACATLGLDAEKLELIRADAAKLLLNLEAPKASAETSAEADTPTAASAPAHSVTAPISPPQEVKRRDDQKAKAGSSKGLWGRVQGFLGLD